MPRLHGLLRSSKAVLAGLTLAGLLVAAGPARAEGSTTTLLEGLSSPKGLSLAPGGDVVVGQGAFGPPGPLLRYSPDTDSTSDLTEPANVIDVAVARGFGWALGSDQALYRFDKDQVLEFVVSIAEYQLSDPDPTDLEGEATTSNPYGLAALRSGDALVTDAEGNDLLRVTPEGDITTVARFDVEVVSTDHFPPEAGLPPEMPAEAVPTSVTVGRDGSIYVGELKGFPFRPGSSNIWKIDPDADGALCSTTTPDPDCTLFDDGFTAIQDIAIDSRSGSLYVYELAAGGVLAFEGGFESGEFPPAVLLEVNGDERTELVSGELSQPGGVAVDSTGLYVTDGLFGNGRLLRVDSD